MLSSLVADNRTKQKGQTDRHTNAWTGRKCYGSPTWRGGRQIYGPVLHV